VAANRAISIDIDIVRRVIGVSSSAWVGCAQVHRALLGFEHALDLHAVARRLAMRERRRPPFCMQGLGLCSLFLAQSGLGRTADDEVRHEVVHQQVEGVGLDRVGVDGA